MRLRTAVLAALLLAACNRGTSGGDAPPADGGGMDAGTHDAGGVDSGTHDAGVGDAGPTPAVFHVELVTTKGTFVVEATRAWAPHGVDRFYELVNAGFYDDCRFFRVLTGSFGIVQFGMNGDPTVNAMWSSRTIPDDPVMMSNTAGTLAFAATSAPDSRTTQLFINTTNNASSLDPQGFAVFGTIISGMSVPTMLYSGYGETPDQTQIASSGNAYLDASFPMLDHIVSARIVP